MHFAQRRSDWGAKEVIVATSKLVSRQPSLPCWLWCHADTSISDGPKVWYTRRHWGQAAAPRHLRRRDIIDDFLNREFRLKCSSQDTVHATWLAARPRYIALLQRQAPFIVSDIDMPLPPGTKCHGHRRYHLSVPEILILSDYDKMPGFGRAWRRAGQAIFDGISLLTFRWWGYMTPDIDIDGHLSKHYWAGRIDDRRYFKTYFMLPPTTTTRVKTLWFHLIMGRHIVMLFAASIDWPISISQRTRKMKTYWHTAIDGEPL